MCSLRLSSLFDIVNIIIKITSSLLSLIVANHPDVIIDYKSAFHQQMNLSRCNHRLQECIPPANEFGWVKCVGSCCKESLGLFTQAIFFKGS